MRAVSTAFRGYVYFIKCTTNGRIKIGYAQESPENRFELLALTCPVELTRVGLMIGGLRFEKRLHRRFAHLRVRSEWFKGEPDLTEYIAQFAWPWTRSLTARELADIPPQFDAIAIVARDAWVDTANGDRIIFAPEIA